MTSGKHDEAAREPQGGGDRAIADYLREHPEFFDRHPRLVAELQIPHASGGAVSLVERQLQALRAENHRLKSRFAELVAIARENERLSQRLHALALALLEEREIGAMIAALCERLRTDFRADAVGVRVFAEPAAAAGDRPEFAGRDAGARAAFRAILEGREPVCGRAAPAQCAAVLERPAAGAMGSAVVVPLIGRGWDGILMVASHDAGRYRADMGIELLAHLGDLTALLIDPWVRRPG